MTEVQMPLDPSWLNKLTLECVDEEDGSMSINIEWDETDPDLDYWNSLGKEGQEKFIMDALTEACNNAFNNGVYSDGI